MDLSDLSSSAPARMRAFPPGRRGVLLPLGYRKTAALGICLYTTSKPWVVALHRAAHRVVSVAGARVLPGQSELWTPPCSPHEWKLLVAAWHLALGPFDGLACYRRRQQARSGLTLLLTRGGTGLALVKVRAQGEGGLQVEQAALAAVARFQPRTFHAPRPLGAGEVGTLGWSAQEAVFSAPHQPVLEATPALFDEVAACLRGLVPAGSSAGRHPDVSGPATVPAHGDLTPWNLRRDTAGQVWLYDWEDVGPAPVEADRAYFCATARSLGGPPMPLDLPARALEHARAVVERRSQSHAEDAALAQALIKALDEVDHARTVHHRGTREQPAPPDQDRV